MTDALRQLLPQIQRLSEEDRAELAHLLLTSLAPDEAADVEVAWATELRRRDEEFRSGRDPGIPGDQVLRELREEFP